MKIALMLCAALTATPFLCAQEEKALQQMPNPKTDAHAALAMLAGTWTSIGKMPALPGVPGMEEAKTWTGTEHAELICDGLWLKSVAESECDGEAMQGLWLSGYDPVQKKYRGIWVSSMDEPCMECDGSYDAATKTWTFTGESPMGEFRSIYKVNDADHSVETCYLVDADGKQTECMRIERTRKMSAPTTVATKAIDAAAKIAKWPSEQHALLAAGVGDWKVTSTSIVPGEQPVQETCSERVMPICDGKWFWSDYTGTMMGQPFEGHALTGYDEAKGQYVSFWIDSMSPTHARTQGTYDPASKQWTFRGECTDLAGKPAKIHQTYVQPDANTRDLQMTFETADGKHEMKLHYVRK